MADQTSNRVGGGELRSPEPVAGGVGPAEGPTSKTDWVALVRELGPKLAEKISALDAADSFVADNYAALKAKGVFAAGVPAELGGGGASHPELCAMIRELAHHCSSTALAVSMHTHLVATQAYLWRKGNQKVEPLLRRVAGEGLVLISTGGSDWLPGSGKLEKVEGGFKMTGRKIFGSGVPAGSLLLTTGVYDDPQEGAQVLHFPVKLDAPGVTVLDTWRVLGMRATGSHDLQLEGVFVPEASVGVRRPAGKWHPFMHAVALVALPVFYAAYLGVAESARDVALELARKKKHDPNVSYLVGEMENLLTTARLAHAGMVDLVATTPPGPEATSAAVSRRTILVNAVLATVNKAMEVAGGGAFYRSLPLERLFRDIQGARYHPMQEKPQTLLTGRVALGLDIDA
jgi:alkylation response protein AidB-like acyl-CoA dehydrogenase